ncbi:hypothetical protein [Paraglaciecola arctica]|uniref:Uncharacterized protein n=1 Tax=Paraglaciecola arctica BSs20135 TaxID=493475 RepID=K6XCR6_9ALTE|nr:hypothetical protein [Paraglaciecola arctica]GAC18419.1 hypothetical protein GARC_1444 [Paraglaciecola arctica BSs20135]|tara:strand:- start:207 stop:425 length:219 start_codon:yes stop_codon:yes gene_type:complete
MNNHLNTICGAHKVNHSSLCAEHYASMDLCSQAQMSEDADNILSRMDKLRAFAKEQQAKRVKSQKQQRSFCF